MLPSFVTVFCMTAPMFWQMLHSLTSSTGRSIFASCGGVRNNVASWRRCVAVVLTMSKVNNVIAFMFDTLIDSQRTSHILIGYGFTR